MKHFHGKRPTKAGVCGITDILVFSTNYIGNMTTKDHLFAQNWVVQFQEDYYGRTSREISLFCNFFLNRHGYILQDIIINCLSWPSCGMREEIWRRRFYNAHQNRKQNALFR